MSDSTPARLEWWPVSDSRSRNTVAWAYDAPSRLAYVEYGAGAIYRYFDVSQSVVQEIQDSGYVSGAIARILKDKSRFNYERVK